MNQTLTRLMLFSAICLLCVSTAMATTTCPSGGYNLYNPQAIGTLSGSITCATNNLSFSEFQFGSSASGGANLPIPAGISVTPLQTLGNEGFSFDPNFTVGAGQQQDASILFEVTAAPGTTINDLYHILQWRRDGHGIDQL